MTKNTISYRGHERNDMKEEKTNVRLYKPGRGNGYFLEVKDEYTTNRLAISKHELLLIWKVVKDEIEKILK